MNFCGGRLVQAAASRLRDWRLPLSLAGHPTRMVRGEDVVNVLAASRGFAAPGFIIDRNRWHRPLHEAELGDADHP